MGGQYLAQHGLLLVVELAGEQHLKPVGWSAGAGATWWGVREPATASAPRRPPPPPPSTLSGTRRPRACAPLRVWPRASRSRT